ncbi:TPA: DUF1542 domain-containing protein, partial [Streptococcus suis]
MSSKDMFRKEQRFSFRKFSFGLASAVIANVIFGGAIASSPVVHANTTTETAAVATSERTASLSYTINIVDQAGKVVDTQTKTVSVKTTEATASTTAYLTTDLVPTGYALVSGLGQVTVTENATNVFTVQVEEIASEAASTAASESATVASETATSESATATSEVAASETATTASETSVTNAERTAYLSYVTQYVNEENEIVDSNGHLVAVTTTDETAKAQVTVSASENMPAGYELAQEKAEVVLQLVENQANVLAFAVAKKSEEEEIAESQLSNRDVLTQVTSEADLLADEALRQVAGEQAGNTALETAANDTKAAAATANEVLANAAATEAELGAQIDTVRTSTQNLAAEMLKVDADGVLTAQLNTTQVSRPANYQEIGTEAGAFHPDRPDITRYLFIFGTSEGATESDENGATGTAPVVDKTKASRALVPEGTITRVAYDNAVGKVETTLGSNLVLDTDGFVSGSFNHTAGGPYTRRVVVTTDAGVQASNAFTTYAYTDKAIGPVEKLEGQALTETDVLGKMQIATTSAAFQNGGKNIPTVPAGEYTRTIVGYRLTPEDADGNVTTGAFVKQTDLAQFPIDKDYQVKVKTTNVYGQTLYNWVQVNYTPTTAVDKYEIFVFNNTPIATVADGTFTPDKVNKVKMATVKDKDGVKSAVISGGGSLGYTITPEANTKPSQYDLYATGTPSVGANGFYSRAITVTDSGDRTTALFQLIGSDDQRQISNIWDVTASVLTKNAGEAPTKEEILAKVEVKTGNSTTTTSRMDLVEGQTLPTAPGTHTVKVRVVTPSNVYKDVDVTVIIPAYNDVLTADATENTSLVPGSGTAAKQPIVIKDANGAETTAPADTTYAIDPAFKAEKEALGYEISVDENGVVSVEAPKGQEADITVPVTVTYPDKTTDKVSVPFKVDQQGLAQLKAKEALDDEAKAAKEAINNNPNLSTKEKEDAVKAVDTATEAAKKAVNDATTIDAVDAAKAAGTKAIDAKELDAAKLDAKNKIAKDVEAANTAIESNPNLSEKEIADAKAAVAKAAEDANKAIDAATTPAEAQTAEDNGVKAIDAAELAAAKQDAK